MASTDRTGHITLRLSLMSGPYAHNWRLETALQLEAGQLDALAQAMDLFFTNRKIEKE
jgi:hypothetical protein